MKKHIAISGKFGKQELKTDGKSNFVEWIGESDKGWCFHSACKWKETSTTVYYKWEN